MLNIWFLIIITSSDYSGTGVVSLPQANKSQCDLNAKWLDAKQYTEAYCVAGVIKN